MCAALCSSQLDRAPIGVLCREIKYLMYLNFVDVMVQHTSCNYVAHHLARMGANLMPGGTLLCPEVLPYDVTELVAADVRSA